MATSLALKLTAPSAWDLLGEVKNKVGPYLKDDKKEVRDAALVAVSELVESAVKLSLRAPKGAEVTLEVLSLDSQLRIRFSAPLQATHLADSAVATVRTIAASKDRRQLYVERLQQSLLGETSGAGALGLYRISGEWGFDLTATLQDTVLEITAIRKAA